MLRISRTRRTDRRRGLRTPRLGTFASLAYVPFRIWIGGQLLAQTGFWFYVVTQALLVLNVTRSGTMVGIATAVQNLPLLFVAPYAGVLIDRLDTRRLMLVTQVVTCLSSIGVGVLVLMEVATPAWILVFAGVTGTAWAFEQPARRTFAAELVPEQVTVNALSLNGVLLQVARMIGPALAALVIHWFGFGAGFIAAGLCIGMSLVAMLAIGRAVGGGSRSVLGSSPGSMREGLGLAWRHRHLRVVLVLLFVTSTFAFNWNVLFPIFAVRDLRGSSATFALLMAAMAVGSMFGAFWLARRETVGVRLLAASSCLYGVAQLAMAAVPNVGPAVITALVLGLGSTILVNGGAADLQLRVDREMRGRMMGLFTVAVLGGLGLGAPLIGYAAQTFGTRLALTVGGSCALVVGLLVLVWARRERHLRPDPVALTSAAAEATSVVQ